jgi:predicted nucleotidyltransferase
MLIETLHSVANRLGRRKVVLFGSRALGTARDRSDFDVGVVGDEAMPLEDFYAIEDLIEALPTLYRIDWVDLARVSQNFRTAAMEHAEILYER